jgi:minichromosome maintenance protein 10
MRSTSPSTSTTKPVTQFPTPQSSTLFSTLLRLEKAADAAENGSEGKEQVERTVGFDDKPSHPQRDDRLALVEDFQMGPYEFTPPVGDPTFEAFEPHSGIVLSYVLVFQLK